MGRRTVLATVVALALAMVGAVGAAGLLREEPASSSPDQCALPLSERTGGWICLGESPAP